MNKHLIVIGITIFLLAVGLSGCQDTTQHSNNQGSSPFELKEYTVESWYDVQIEEDDRKIGDGFTHQPEVTEYRITGVVENQKGEDVDLLFITGRFYDSEGTFIINITTSVEYVSAHSVVAFTLIFEEYETRFFNSVESVSFYFRER